MQMEGARKPSARALQVYGVICEEFAAGRKVSYRELCARLGMRSLHTVHRHLKNLQARGFIERAPRKHRSIKPSKIELAALEQVQT